MHAFRRVIEMEAGQEIRVGSLTIRATYAEHYGTRVPLGTKVAALGYVLVEKALALRPGSPVDLRESDRHPLGATT